MVKINGVKQAPGAVGCFNRYYYVDPNKLFYVAWEEKLRLISKIELRIIFSFSFLCFTTQGSKNCCFEIYVQKIPPFFLL